MLQQLRGVNKKLVTLRRDEGVKNVYAELKKSYHTIHKNWHTKSPPVKATENYNGHIWGTQILYYIAVFFQDPPQCRISTDITYTHI